MINLASSLCICPPKKPTFDPKAILDYGICECPQIIEFLVQEIQSDLLCPCPLDPPVVLRLPYKEIRTTTKNCYSDYIKQISKVKLCSPSEPKCV